MLCAGTGCFMLYNTGTDIVKSTHGLVTTVRPFSLVRLSLPSSPC